MKRTFATYAAKMRQSNREAAATLVALALIVAVWLIGGVGLAGCGIEVFSTPLWIIGGLIGPWAAAIVAAVVLARCVFADFSLDDEEAVGSAAEGAPAPASPRAAAAGAAAAGGVEGEAAEEVRHG